MCIYDELFVILINDIEFIIFKMDGEVCFMIIFDFFFNIIRIFFMFEL